MTTPTKPSDDVVLRDMLIFQGKLWLDGLKDLVLAPLSLFAGITDLMFGYGSEGPRLYKVLHLGERFDLWLNLYGASAEAGKDAEGLFGGSEPGDGTLLGDLEEFIFGKKKEKEKDAATGAD